MNTAFDVLVIVLSSLLGIFLVLSIITTVLVLKLMKSLRQMVAKGERLVDSAEAIGEVLRENAGAAGIIHLLMKFVGSINNRRNKGE